MKHSSRMASSEDLVLDKVPDGQRDYFLRFLRYTRERGDPDHGVHIVREQIERGLLFDDELLVRVPSENLNIFAAGKMIGVSAAKAIVDVACALTDRHQMATVCCAPIQHVGSIGFHLNEVANQGYIAIAFLATHPIMSTPQCSTRVVGNNVMSLAIPHAKDRNIVLDMSTGEENVRSLVSKAVTADPNGMPQSTYEDLVRSRSLLPAGAHKGAALAIAIQFFLTALSGISPPEAPEKLTDHCDNQLNLICIKPDVGKLAAVGRELQCIKSRFSELYIPGERSWA